MTKTRSTPNFIKILSIIFPVMTLLVLASLPLRLGNYMMRVMNIALITYLCVLSMYVLLGMCGQNSFAQAGLWGVGAYITGNMALHFELPHFMAMLIATAGTAVFSFVLGFAFFRLRQFYFTFASIGLMTILNGLFMNWEPVTGGALGMQNIPKFSAGGVVFDNEVSFFYMLLFICAAVFLLMRVLFDSVLGRSFMAIRDNEIAANCMGINSLLTKSIAFGISGALCGIAGALYAFLSGYLSSQTFTFQQSTMYLIMIMLGGTISPSGAFIGTMIIVLSQEFVRPLANYMQLIYGAGIMILMIVQPEGILGGGKAIYERYLKRQNADA